MVEKEEIRELAIKLLKSIDLNEIETIDLDSTDYDDGSKGLTISVTYPAKKGGEDIGQKGNKGTNN